MNKQEIREAIYELFRLKNRLTCSQWYGIQTQEANKYTAECLRLAISALIQQLTGGWIPVSERLPESDDKNNFITALVCWRYKGNDEIHQDIAIFCADINDWSIYDLNINDIEVIAWMPLPEPYREEDNDADSINLDQNRI